MKKYVNSSHLSVLFVTNSPRLEDSAAEITDEQLLIAVQIMMCFDIHCNSRQYTFSVHLQVLSGGIYNAEGLSPEMAYYISVCRQSKVYHAYIAYMYLSYCSEAHVP